MQPLIFLESDRTVRIGACSYVPESDRFLFEPGLFAFQILCAIVSGKPAAACSTFDPLILIDGPANPMIDDGFHLFQLVDEVAGRFAAMPAHWIEDVVATLQQEFQRNPSLHGPHERIELASAVCRLTNMAHRGELADKSLFIEILNR